MERILSCYKELQGFIKTNMTFEAWNHVEFKLKKYRKTSKCIKLPNGFR